MEPVFVEVGTSGLQTFNIREKEAVTLRVLFEHFFLCDHFQESICNVFFIKGSSTPMFFWMFSKVSLEDL